MNLIKICILFQALPFARAGTQGDEGVNGKGSQGQWPVSLWSEWSMPQILPDHGGFCLVGFSKPEHGSIQNPVFLRWPPPPPPPAQHQPPAPPALLSHREEEPANCCPISTPPTPPPHCKPLPLLPFSLQALAQTAAGQKGLGHRKTVTPPPLSAACYSKVKLALVTRIQ